MSPVVDTQKQIQAFRKEMQRVISEIIDYLNKKQDRFFVNYLFGVYRGFVEYANDPLNIGRAKVRIPFIHGDQKMTATPELPWAIRCELSGGGADHGSCFPFRIGDSVLVAFESGSPDYPIILGAWKGVPGKEVRYNTIETKVNGVPATLPLRKPSGGTFYGPARPEAPTETQDIAEGDPTVTVVFKTFKGHTMVIDDRDENEHMEIVDRAGQSIHFNCPIKTSDNDGNAARRKTAKGRTGDATDRGKMVDEETELSITDIVGGGLKLTTAKGGEGMEISSKDDQNKESGNSDNQMSFKLSTGEKVVTLEGKKDGDKKVSLSLNADTGQITIKSEGMDLKIDYLKVKSLDVEGNLNVDGDILAAGNIFSMKDMASESNQSMDKFFGESI